MDIKIIVKSQAIPITIFNDFEKSFDQLSITVNKEYLIDKFDNATGQTTGNIIIDISPHLTNLLTDGLIYDALKTSIIFGWQQFLAYLKVRQKPIDVEKDYISLNISIAPDSTIEYKLEGNVDNETVIKLTMKILNYLKNKDTKNDFANSDFVTNVNDKPKIRFKFDEVTKEWKPVNFGDNRRYWEDQREIASQKYNN